MSNPLDELLEANRAVLQARRAVMATLCARERVEVGLHDAGMSKAAIQRLGGDVVDVLAEEDWTVEELAQLGASGWSIRQRLDRPRSTTTATS